MLDENLSPEAKHGIARTDTVQLLEGQEGGSEFIGRGDANQRPPATVTRAAENLFKTLVDGYSEQPEEETKVGAIWHLDRGSRKQITVELDVDPATTVEDFEYSFEEVTRAFQRIFDIK